MANKKEISVVLLDDHSILRDCLEVALNTTDGVHVIGSIGHPSELSKCLDFTQADVVLMGLVFEICDSLRSIADCIRVHPRTKILVLSQLPEAIYAPRVLKAGACGFLMKTVSLKILLDSIRQVTSGAVAVSPAMASHLLANYTSRNKVSPQNGVDLLSNRELHVFSLIGLGYTTASVASHMGISKKTVDSFKERIKIKLDLQNSMQLAQVAVQHSGRFQSFRDVQ